MSLGKHFINDVEDPVDRALREQLIHDESLHLIETEKVLFRQPSPGSRKVILLSGGGSGHEPAHIGYVGEGMLDVCVSGNIFASPSARQILAGLDAVDAPSGTLMIVKNYTGDKLNFGLAAEKAKAQGQRVNVVIVGDDVSTGNSGLVGRRGFAGVTFVHKVSGAAAASGMNLDEVTIMAQRTARSLATAGASLDYCSVPQRVDQTCLPVDQLEYGMGIHNEPGVQRATIGKLSETVSRVVEMVVRPRDQSWSPTPSQELALMVNNLGGLSVLELNMVAGEVDQQLRQQGFTIKNAVTGTFMSALDGPGFSVTLLGLDEEIERLLDVPTRAPAWPRSSAAFSETVHERSISGRGCISRNSPVLLNPALQVPATLINNIIISIAESIKEAEPLITKYDTIAGDGDCGQTLLAGVNGVVREAQVPIVATKSIDLLDLLRRIASSIELSMGGTSGAIYAIFFNALCSALSSSTNANISNELSPQQSPLSRILSQALKQSLNELYKYTAARQGHRTLMDALIPFVETYAVTGDLDAACAAASGGAESTRRLPALLGRASYVNQDRFGKSGIPDPGALGAIAVLGGIQRGLKLQS